MKPLLRIHWKIFRGIWSRWTTLWSIRNPEPFVATAPEDLVCSDVALAHDLSADVDLVGTTFSWLAADNTLVDGETLVASALTNITDTLTNVSGIVQIIEYTITPTSADGCIGDPYVYTVTVSPEAELVVTKSTIAALDGAYDTLGEIIQYEINEGEKLSGMA